MYFYTGGYTSGSSKSPKSLQNNDVHSGHAAQRTGAWLSGVLFYMGDA